MTHGDSLVLTVEATQRCLEEKLGEALAPHRNPERPRERYAATDGFMAATSRHLAAVEAVLLPCVRRVVPEGDQLVHDYLAAARKLEHTLAVVKAKLYGEVHAVHLEWPALWSRVQAELVEHDRLESRMVEGLVEHGDAAEVDGLAQKVFEAEKRAPTRPHPHLPHLGVLGGVSRRVWAVADRFWDTAEGRVIDDPVPPKPHTHDSLLAQYLVADPKFDGDATVLEHRRRQRRAS
ncbi:hypothetical protein [Nocardioides caldifontis]|uniref:hypothetical protein n=1 Tax=Nocardioides caldifontis TaxID=2588938 RepID=UPI0011DFE415|nr:hypothetical protein [Nocardioides caldifontis]